MHKIFSYLIGDEANVTKVAYMSWFTGTFPSIEFKDDEHLFFEFLEYCSELNVVAKRRYLETWCSTELKPLLRRTNIKVAGCESINMDEPVGFEEVFRITQQVLLDDYDVLDTLEADTEDFPVEVAAFIRQRKEERMISVLSKTFDKLQATHDATTAGDFALNELSLISEIYAEEVLEDLNSTVRNGVDKSKLIKFANYCLPAIDADSKGIFCTQLVDIEAQPGTGKTRYTIGCPCYDAVVNEKRNVLYVTLEQDVCEIEAGFVARHVFELFGVQVNTKLITTDTVPEELKSKVEAARIDLFDSGKYGKLVIKAETFYVETFMRRLRNIDNLLGPFDIIAIDYVGLIESSPGPYQKEKTMPEIVSTSLKLLKRYARSSRKAIISISQLNRDGIAAGEADKKITPEMAMGGIAVYRHTDYNVAITATDEMKAMNKRRFSQPKVRDSAGFGTFLASVWLGVCYFKQDVAKAV